MVLRTCRAIAALLAVSSNPPVAPALRARARALGLDGRLKVGDVRAELRDKIGGQTEADELRGERRRVGLKGAGGIEQRRVAGAAGHEKFSLESRRAHQHEGMRGVGDAVQIVVEMKASGDLGQDARVRGFRAGNLRGAERGGLRHGGVTRANCCPPMLVAGKSAAYFAPKASVVLKVAVRLAIFCFIMMSFLIVVLISLPERAKALRNDLYAGWGRAQ